MVAFLVVAVDACDVDDADDDADAVVDACDVDVDVGGEEVVDMMDLHLAVVDVAGVVWQAWFEMVISMLPSD